MVSAMSQFRVPRVATQPPRVQASLLQLGTYITQLMLMLSSNSHPLLYSYTMHCYASNMIGSLQQPVSPLVALSAVVKV